MLYVVNFNITHPVYLATRHDVDAWRWHDRFGHMSFNMLRCMSRNKMVCGLPELEHVDYLCDVFITTKHRHIPFPKKGELQG